MKTFVSVFALWLALSGLARAADPGPLETAPTARDAPYAASSASTSSSDDAAPGPRASTPSTKDQIANWISSEESDSDSPSATDPGPPPPRAIHGEVGAGVGSRGYRSVYGIADIPVGQDGDLDVAASNASLDRRHGGGSEITSLAVGLRLGTSPASGRDCGVTRSVWLPTDDRDAAACAAAAH